MAYAGGQRRGYQRKDTGREFQRRPGRGKSAAGSNGVWRPAVPSWEKEYCKSVGLPWDRLCSAKYYMDVCTPESVRRWDDSAGEEAFQNAKRKYLADRNGVPCDVPPPNPDLCIDEIDWDSHELGNFEGLDISGSESESDNEDGLSYNYGNRGYDKENFLGNGRTVFWRNENIDPITKYISALNGVKILHSDMGWSDCEDNNKEPGGVNKETDDRGWGVLENGDVNFTGWDYKNETERKTNGLENCAAHENAMQTTPGWGNYPARASKGQVFQGRNGWKREVGGDSGNQKYPYDYYKSAIEKQYIPSGRSKQLHCSVYPQYQKKPFAPRHWNAMPQTPQQRMNRPARRNSNSQVLHNGNWGNLSKGFNQAGHWRSRPEYKQGSCPVSTGQNVQQKSRDPLQGDFPVRNNFTRRWQA